MKRVLPIIERQRIFLAVEGEAAMPDSIAIAANQRAEECIRWAVEVRIVAVDIVKSKHHVAHFAAAVGRLQ